MLFSRLIRGTNEATLLFVLPFNSSFKELVIVNGDTEGFIVENDLAHEVIIEWGKGLSGVFKMLQDAGCTSDPMRICYDDCIDIYNAFVYNNPDHFLNTATVTW